MKNRSHSYFWTALLCPFKIFFTTILLVLSAFVMQQAKAQTFSGTKVDLKYLGQPISDQVTPVLVGTTAPSAPQLTYNYNGLTSDITFTVNPITKKVIVTFNGADFTPGIILELIFSEGDLNAVTSVTRNNGESTYSNPNALSATRSGKTITFSFDGNINTSSGGAKTFVFDFTSTSTGATPTITTTGVLSAVNTTYGAASATPTSFTVSGTDMTAGILLTPPAGFELSQTAGGASGYAGRGNAITVGGSGTIATTTIYVRLAANAPVATYTGNIVCTSSGATTRNVATASSSVSARALSITASTANKNYGQTLTGGSGSTAFTPSGLQNSETIGSVTIAYTAGATNGNTAADPVGTYTGKVTPSAATGGTFTASNYAITYTAGSIVVGTVPLTITASTANKNYGSTLTGGSGSTAFTSSGLQNSETIGSVTIAYTAGATNGNTAADPVGTYTGKVTPSAATGGTFTASNYTITYIAGNIVVGTAPLTITATTANKNYGQTLTGGSGSTAFTSSGLQNSQTIGSVTIGYTAGAGNGNTAADAVGTYTGRVTPSAATGGTFTASNYTITYTAGNIVVGAAPLTITASTANKNYGQTLTGGSGSTAFTSSGLQNSQTIGSVTIAYAAGAGNGNTAADAVGTYTGKVTPSSATGGTFTASNYAITYTAGNIVVGTAPLTITATTANKNYGQTLTGGSGSTAFTSSGLQNSETIGSVTIAYAAGAGNGNTAADAVGTYTGKATPSSATGGTFTASNYNITYTAGNIIIGTAPLTITASDQNKSVGATLNLGTTAFTSSGLQNSETIGGVTLNSTGAINTAPVNDYPIIPSAATGGTFTSSNYTISYINGTLHVTAAVPTITTAGVLSAVNTTYGAASATPTSFTVSGTDMTAGILLTPPAGFELSQTAGGASGYAGRGNAITVGGSGTIATTTIYVRLAANAPVATYTGNIVCTSSGATTRNVATASSSVSARALSITASTANKDYGQTLTGGSGSTAFTPSGLQNGETIGSVTIAYTAGATNGNTAADPVGTYTGKVTPSAATGGTFTASNYTITYTAGNIVVGTVPLTITATTANKNYGSTLTGGTGSTAFTSSGLQNGETIGSVTIAYTAGATNGNTAADPVGTYTGKVTPSAATGGTFTASNYAITYTTGNIVVGTAPLTITATTANKNYGSTLTGGTGSTAFTSSGLQNGETIGSVTIGYTAGATNGNTAADPVGTYTGRVTPSTATGGTFTASNYAITYTAGNIVVGTAPLTITATTANKNYGQTLTGESGSTAFTSSGLQNSQTIGSVTIAYAAGAGNGNTAADPVGTYTGKVTPSAATGGSFTASNYAITYTAGNIVVGTAPLTITATTANKNYGQTLIGGTGSTAFTSNGLQNGETIGSVTIGYTAGATNGNTAADPVGTYTGKVTPSAATGGNFTASNYNITYTTGNIVVGTAPLTITATTANKNYGSTLTGGTGSTAFTSSGLQNGETIGSVTIAYGTGAAGAAAVGSYTGSVTPSAATGGTFTASNYAITYTAGNIVVGTAPLTITATTANKNYGSTLTGGTGSTAFTSSGLQNGETIGSVTIAYTAGASNGNTAADPVGTYTGKVTPSAATGGTFTASNYAITYTTGNIVVGTAPLTITASTANKNYGQILTGGSGSTAFTSSGLQNGETIGSVTIGYTAGATNGNTAADPVGTYTGKITPSAATGGNFTASNYTITYTAGNIVVGTAPLTITATTVNKNYGSTIVGGTGSTAFTSSGLQNGETIGSVTIAYGTGAAGAAAVGSYTGSVTPSAATGGTFTASNYTITYTAGNIVVGTAPLTITATTANKNYGQTLTGGTGSTAFTSSGLQNGETIGSVTIAYTAGATNGNTATDPVGTYTGKVTPSAATGGNFTASNYNITYTTGNIVVGTAPLTITATTANKNYGSTLTGGTGSTAFTSSGLQNGETIGSVTIAYGTGAAGTAAVGSYMGSVTPSTATGGTFTASNYTITYTAGNIVIGAKAVTVTADARSKAYGDSDPALTYTVSPALVSGDSFTGSLSRTPGENVGLYNITQGTLALSSNYTLSYIGSDLTITAKALTITATTVNKNYGQTLTGGTGSTAFTSSGLQNGETIGSVTIAYGTGAAGAAAVGSYTGSVTPSAATGGSFTASNYTITYTAGNIVIGAKAVTVTADARSKAYGDSDPALTYTVSPALVSGDSFTGSLSRAPGENVGLYNITQGTLALSSNYTLSYIGSDLTITAKPLTITATTANKNYGSTLTGGTGSTAFTSSGLQNGETIGSVTITYTAGATNGNTAADPVGIYTGKVTPSAATGETFTASNYTITYTAGNIVVGAKAVTVTADARSKAYGDSDPALTYTVSPALVSGDSFTGTLSRAPGENVGLYNITQGTLALSSNYALSYIGSDLTITVKALTITATTVNKNYGSTLTGGTGSTAFTSSGLQNGETIGSVTIAYTAGASNGNTAADPVGTYTGKVTPSAATGGTFTASNYAITYTAGNIIVGTAPLTITASTANKNYGQTLTGGSGSTAFTSSGLQNSETIGSVTIGYTAGATNGNTAADPVGTYTGKVTPSTATGGTFTASNYTITYTAGNIVIGAKAVTVTADTRSKAYGDSDPALTYTVSPALVSGDSFTGSLSRAPGENVGLHNITKGTLALSSNYTLSYIGSDLTITAKALTITATTVNKNYGSTIVGGTGSTAFTSSGLQNGETIGSVTIAYGTGAAGAAAVGSYTGSVTPSAATGGTFTASNYTITYTAGNIVVGTAPLTITATTANKNYGQTLTGGTGSTAFTSSGLQNGETIGSVTIAYTAGATNGNTATDPVGTYTGKVTPSAATGGNFTASNYNITYTTGNIVVGTAPLTITATTANKNYGSTLTGGTGSTAFTSSGLQNGETIGSVTIAYGTGAAGTAAVGSYMGSVTPSTATGGTFTASNYTITYTAGNIVIGAKAVTVTADARSKAYGDSDPALTYTVSPALVSGDSFTGSLSRTPGENVGLHTITQGTLALSSNYTLSYIGADLTINAKSITVTADAKNKIYGDADPASYTYTYTPSLVSGDSFTGVLGRTAGESVGTYGININTLALSSNYTLTYNTANLTIAKKTLTVTAEDKTKIYGATNPALTVRYTGFAFSDNNLSLTTQPAATTTATDATSVGNYTITPAGGVSSNYTFNYVTGTLIITGKAIAVNADAKTKAYGEVDPALTYTFAPALVSGDSFTGTLSRLAGESAGIYEIDKGTLNLSSNYILTFTGNNLTIGKKTLTVTAADNTKVYGTANPALTVTYAGFALGDNEQKLTTKPIATTTANTTTGVGNYTITASGGADNNYAFNYVSGMLNITPAVLTITAEDKSKVYGATNPSLTISYIGFVNGDTNTNLTTQPAISTTATNSSAVGSYPITASGAASANYSISYIPGALTVTRALLTITAEDKSKIYGAINPSLTVSYNGFVNGDTNTNLTTQPAISTTAMNSSAVGSYPITASGAVSANYSISYIPGALTVTRALLTITAEDKSKLYGANNPSLTVSYTGFVNGDTNTNLTTQPAISTTATNSSAVGSYPITASGAVSANYSITYTPGALTVTRALLTITAEGKSKIYGAINPSLTVSYNGFVNGDTNTNLTTQPAISTTATNSSAVGSYPITASGAVSANYSITYTPGVLTVTRAVLIITAENKGKIYGTANPSLTVSYNGFVNGDTNTNLTTQPSVSTTATNSSGVGNYLITATGAVSPNYTFNYITGILTVTPATLTIIADNKTRAYGATNPVLTVSYNGFVNGDTNVSLTTQPIATTTATNTTSIGSYPITVGGAANPNYTISYNLGTLTISPAVLTITAENKSKIYGAANPSLTASYSGFINGDTNASLITQPTISTTATNSSGVGNYSITANGATIANYTIIYSPGTLTVTPAALIITADNKAKSFGTANPLLTASYSGFVNGDTNVNLTTQPTISTTATNGSAVGSYPIMISGATSANYTISYVSGTLSVTNTVLTITADSKSKTYGGANPVLTVTYSGFVNGDTQANITTLPLITTTATVGSNAGTYAINVTGAVLPGYIINYVPGTLTVNRAPLTITADDKTKVYNTANPTLTANFTGFVNGDTQASLTTQPTLTTTATTTTLPGVYDITVSGATSNNYTITSVGGKLTISALNTAFLSNLSISSGILSPTFNATTTTYTTPLSFDVESVTVTANFDASARATINGLAIPNGSASALINVPVGTSTITVLVTAQDGITKNTYTITLNKALPPSAIVPTNIVSPNGDGKNDGWIVKDIEKYPNNEVIIYDRAGREVYRKRGYTNDWNGSLNGAPLAQGTYFYVVKLDPKMAPIKGYITVLRSR